MVKASPSANQHRKPESGILPLWSTVQFIWRSIPHFALTSAVILATFAIALIAWDEFASRKINIETISVPKLLAEQQGFTENVATQKLRDAITELTTPAFSGAAVTCIADVAVLEPDAVQIPTPGPKSNISPPAEVSCLQSELKSMAVQLPIERPRIEIPEIQVPLDAVATSILNLLGVNRQINISGEFTDDGSGPRLTLRHDGQIIFPIEELPTSNLKIMLTQAAENVLDTSDQSVAVARHYLVSNNMRMALDKVNSVIAYSDNRDDEDVLEALLLRGMIFRRIGTFKDAIDSVDEVLSRKPQISLVHRNIFLNAYELRGEILFHDGNNHAAGIAAFRDAVRWAPYNMEAHLVLGHHLEECKDALAAISEYQHASDLSPRSTTPHEFLYGLFRKLNNREAMTGEYEQLKRLDVATAHVVNADTLRLRHRFNAANFEYHVALTYDRKNKAAYVGIGRTLEDQSNREGAIAAYKIAAAELPHEPAILDRLGELLLFDRKIEDARQQFTKALRLDPSDARANLDLIHTFVTKGQLDVAEKGYIKFLENDPRNPTAHIRYGELLADRQKLKEAQQQFEAAATIDPGNREARNGMGFTAELGHNYDTAIAYYDSILRENSNDPIVLNNRCYTRALQGRRLDLALADCDRSLKLMPNETHTLDSRGLVELRLNKFAAAVHDYQAALAINPSAPNYQYELGVAECLNGDVKKGEPTIAEALKKSPQQGKLFGEIGVVAPPACASETLKPGIRVSSG